MAKITAASRAAIYQLWDDLADADRADGDAALIHLLRTLAHLTNAQNAWWLGIVRVGAVDVGDPLRNWRLGAIRYLHESPQDRAFYRNSERQLAHGAMDESVIATARNAGTFRVLWLPKLVTRKWYTSPFHGAAYGARGIHDAIFVGCPVNAEAESLFGFHRKEPRQPRFGAADRAVLGYALRGLRWFQRQVLLNHGLLMARHPLTPTERRILRHLLTRMPEYQIAGKVGLAPATTHNHVTSIYRKLGVNSRVGLMALWLGQPMPDHASQSK